MNGVEPPVSFPAASNSGSNENPPTEVIDLKSTGKEFAPQARSSLQVCSDVHASQDFTGGMMKIVPSDVDVCVVILSNLFLQLIIAKQDYICEE